MNELRRYLEECYLNEGSDLAIQTSTERLSYGELHSRRRMLEGLLGPVLSQQKNPVGLLLPKSSNAIAAILACLQLDVPYVPIDFEAPPSRGTYILQDAGCQLLITTQERASSLASVLGVTGEVVDHPELDLSVLILAGTSSTETWDKIAHKPAYLLYTSGSTGRPKGVMISAENAVCFVHWAQGQFSVAASKTIASIAPFHFDLSTFDLFVSLKCGATIALFTEKETKNPMLLAHYLAEWRVNIMYATPSLLQLLSRYGKLDQNDYSALEQVLFAGEVFPIPAFRALAKFWPAVQFYNLYGPTETNVVTWFAVPLQDQQQHPYPIGELCPYAEGLLRSDGQYYWPEAGKRGELLICGPSVASGYLNLPHLEQERFINIAGKTWYATGDLVTVDENNQLVYAGRLDRMLKRRGFRIELAEIEHCMSHHPDIIAFGAVVLSEDDQAKIIGCYQAESSISELALKQYLADHLPLYMQPDRYLRVEQIPLTSSQKVDFPALKNIVISNV